MFYIGITFAVLCALSKALDALFNKDIMKNQSAGEHSVFRIIFVLPVLLIFALFNWNFQIDIIWWLLLYGVLESINILAHQLAIKKSNPFHVEIISKSKVIFTLIVSFVLVIDTLTLLKTIGIAVFMIGAVLSINRQNKDSKEKTGPFAITMEIVSVLARTFKPFILKNCVNNNLISNETLTFLSMIVALIILGVIFRPKVDFKTLPCKKYLLQSTIVGLGMLFSGYAVIYSNTVIVNAIETTSVIFLMLITFFFYKKKYTLLSTIGAIISVIGIILAIVL